MTLQEKLENFKSKPVGFHVRTEEIAVLLGRALDNIGIKGNAGDDMVTVMKLLWSAYGYMCDVMYISWNHPKYHELMCGHCYGSRGNIEEIYEVTVEELKEYLGKAGE